MGATIRGDCDPRFALVREEFERNFAERRDVGGAVCVTLDGEPVVDLWGGVADPATGADWQRDTAAVVWSCTKGATAICAHMLVSRGQLDLDAPVVQYWPEFAPHGKDTVPVRMLLSHQAGLAAIRAPLPEGAYYDWDYIVRALEDETPFWTPGTQHGYHAQTFGHLVGEVMRRVTGKSVGTFFAEEVAGPLGADFWIGLPEDLEPRIAPNIPHEMPGPEDPIPTALMTSFTQPDSLQSLVYNNHGGVLLQPNERRFRAAEIPALNGIANARGLAYLYRPLALGGAYRDVRLVDEEVIPTMSTVASAGIDAFGLAPTRFSLGFVKCMDNRRDRTPGDRESVLLSESAFGHLGFGGSYGFADPGARMSIGYTTNKQIAFQVLDARGQALLDATYRSLGYRLSPGGIWFN
jgi:CubicO group peptidase (beta-lactamase class C family)